MFGNLRRPLGHAYQLYNNNNTIQPAAAAEWAGLRVRET